MPTIQFETGQKVQFDGNPTPQDVEEVANKLGINKSQAPEEKFGSGLPGAKQMTGQEFINQPKAYQIAQAFVHTIPQDITAIPKTIAQAGLELGSSALQGLGQIGVGVGNALGMKGGLVANQDFTVPGLQKTRTIQNQAQDVLNAPPTQSGPIENAIFTPKAQQYLNSNQEFSPRAFTGPILKALSDAAVTTGALNDVKNIGAKVLGDYNFTTGEATPGLVQKIPGAVKNVVGNIQEGGQDILKKNAMDIWEKPTTIPKASYRKPTEIYNNALDNENNITERLINNKILPSENITGKNWDTLTTAENIRTDNGLASRNMLRPLLEKASPGVPYVPTEDILNEVKNNIANDQFILPEDKVTLLNRLDSKIAPALDTKYPDGFSMVNLHDEKILRDMNAGYKWNGTLDDNLTATLNKKIADVARNTLEDVAPKSIPVEAFNQELQKNYQMADYLESLHGKAVPTGVLSKVANMGGKIAGLATAQHLGGGVLMDVAGYHIGGMVENILAGMPGEVRDSLLNSLEQTNPEAFQAVSDALGQVTQEQASRLALPAPGSTAQGPIQLPQPGVLQGQENLRQIDYPQSQGEFNDAVNILKSKYPNKPITTAEIPISFFDKVPDVNSESELTPYINEIQSGQKFPIVAEYKNGTYRIIDGEHRYLAYQRLGVNTIPTITQNSPTAEQIIEGTEGFKPGMRLKFDTALINKDAKQIKKLLPQIPKEYAQRFADAINKILKR